MTLLLTWQCPQHLPMLSSKARTMTRQLPDSKIKLHYKAALRPHDEQPPPPPTATQARNTCPTACHATTLAQARHLAPSAGERTVLNPQPLIPPRLCQCHLRMEGLPAQACDPLAVASEGPAHLLPCAWVPQENLKDRSLLNNPPRTVPGSTAPNPSFPEDPRT